MRTNTFPATHDDSWNKKKKKKNPAAKTSVDINIDCHIFIRAAKYSEKKIGVGERVSNHNQQQMIWPIGKIMRLVNNGLFANVNWALKKKLVTHQQPPSTTTINNNKNG